MVFIIMPKTFIKIDSLQHLEISRQTYPTNWLKIHVTTSLQHSLFGRFANFPKLIQTIHTCSFMTISI